jgi:DNA-binding NtrC family response regulator
VPAVQETSTAARNGSWAQMLLLNDDSTLRSAYREVAEELGFAVHVAESPEQGTQVLEEQRAEAALVDLSLPEPQLIEVLRALKERRPEAEVVLMSNSATVTSAVQAMRLGAFEYVTKPFDAHELRQLLERLASHLKMTSESRTLREHLRTKQGFGNIIGHSPEMEKLYRMISKAACSTHPVLILGESGTGKELVARSIHYSGPHSDKPFIPVDCGSLVPTLIESELFGYVRGAFTGANRAKEGLLAIANGGTVFLDEIGELPVDLQAKLLRTLQEKEIRPVGSNHTVKVNVRILAATNRNLEVAVENGGFRKDLFYRLNVLSLRIPSLRERQQDIPMLCEFFLNKLVRTGGAVRSISAQGMELLMAYDWPGNVRELENCLDRACAMSSGPGLHVGDLPSPVRNARHVGVAAAVGEAENGRIVNMAELEKRAILAALEQLHGDKLLAARMLGIGKTTLYRKLKEYGVQ